MHSLMFKYILKSNDFKFFASLKDVCKSGRNRIKHK